MLATVIHLGFTYKVPIHSSSHLMEYYIGR